jgi:sialate O-acetylesterase
MVLLATSEIFPSMKYLITYVFFILLGCPFFSQAQLQIAVQFSDNMVLQRNQPIMLWGKGKPDEKIDAQLGSLTASAIVQQNSSWQINFPPQPATASPLQLMCGCALVSRIWNGP